jgi:hypothetical protein
MKTSYQKHWDKEGTVYDQTITIDNPNFLELVNTKINLTLQTVKNKTELTNNEWKLQAYLKPLVKGYNYTTHTTRNFVFNVLLGVKIKDRNTIINIK